MLHYRVLALLVCAVCLAAQSPADPEVARVQIEIEKLRGLVEAGAAPRAQLERAEARLADAEDAAYLRKTLYGQELTLDDTEDMMAAAGRRVERRQKALDDARKLVDAGVAPRASLESFQDELDSSRKELTLAESRAALTVQLTEMARAEEDLDNRLAQGGAVSGEVAERFDGDGIFTAVSFNRVAMAFESQFGKPLPVSAIGETAVHRALGFDHRGRVDVALNPDQPEGIWLRNYLTQNHIPFFAFRQAVPGKATGAHIHLGPGSTRLRLGG